MSESVNHPAHYNAGKFEVIEIIEDQGLGFHLGNAVKYICRAGKKDASKVVEDLKKAVWYLQRQIETLSPDPRRPNDMNPRVEISINPAFMPKHCQHGACMNLAEYVLLAPSEAEVGKRYCAECVVTRERLKKEMR